MKVAVVTPTIASEHLKKCIDSVDKQTYENIVHYIFIDGCQYEPKARKILVGSSSSNSLTSYNSFTYNGEYLNLNGIFNLLDTLNIFLYNSGLRP